MVREITVKEFNENHVLPVLFAVAAESKEPVNAEFFVPHWRQLMELGVARTFIGNRAVLGMILGRNTFSGELQALVSFWLVHPETRKGGDGLRLLRLAEKAAKAAGAKHFYSAAFYLGRSFDATYQIYEHRGYDPVELAYRKEL